MKYVGEIISIIAIVSNLTFLIILEGYVERSAVVIFIAVLVLVYAQLRANRVADKIAQIFYQHFRPADETDFI